MSDRTQAVREHVEHFRARVLQDALQEATGAYWRRRGDTFADVGTPTCDEIAKACWHKAELYETGRIPALTTYDAHAAIREVTHARQRT